VGCVWELNLNRAIGIFLIVLLSHSAFPLQETTGSICVAPLPKPVGSLRGAGPESVACAADKYAVKIDSRKLISWPVKGSVEITGLDRTGRHRVVVFCGNKPSQTFNFQFSEFNDKKLCLFLNDLYWTVQLWPDKQCPWCKCK
jgi:hypothetical protein